MTFIISVIVVKVTCSLVQSGGYWLVPSLEWGLGVRRDWDPVRMMNQTLSRYCMHIELSFESNSEYGPLRS